jgi:PAS domain S-box-containing protein
MRDNATQVEGEELEARYERLRAIFDNTVEIIVGLLSPDGIVLDANLGAKRVLGDNEMSVVGRPFWETPFWSSLRESDRLPLRESIEATASGKNGRLEVEHASGAGGTRFMDISSVAVRGEDGSIRFLVLEGRDITERRRAEEARRISEQKFSSIVQIASDAIITIDQRQRIVIYNRGAEDIFGWKREEVEGQSLDVLLPERFRDVHRRQVSAFGAAGEPSRRMAERKPEIFGLRKNGQEFAAEAAISRTVINGEPLYSVILRDVSERKRLEHTREVLAAVGSVFGETLDPHELVHRVADILAQSVADWCIVDLVDGGQLSRATVAHTASADADLMERTRQSLFSTGEVRSLLLEGRQCFWMEDCTSLGTVHPTLAAALEPLVPRSTIVVPLGRRDVSVGALALVSCSNRRLDRHVLRLAEELALRLSLALENAQLYQAARRAIRARDEVFGIVAHDLRNPIGTIKLNTTALERCVDRAAVPKAAKFIEGIERSVTRADRLVQDLLDVARIEAGCLSLSKAPTEAGSLIEKILASQEPHAAAVSARLQPRIPPNLPLIECDGGRVLQVLENLVGNALKFTPPGGQIEISAVDEGDLVKFSVRDTGEGIAADKLPHIFDRFWQGEPRRRDGAGLGLAICKGIVEGHGGSIWAESSQGQGTTVSFTIPTAQVREDRVPRSADSTPGTGRS